MENIFKENFYSLNAKSYSTNGINLSQASAEPISNNQFYCGLVNKKLLECHIKSDGTSERGFFIDVVDNELSLNDLILVQLEIRSVDGNSPYLNISEFTNGGSEKLKFKQKIEVTNEYKTYYAKYVVQNSNFQDKHRIKITLPVGVSGEFYIKNVRCVVKKQIHTDTNSSNGTKKYRVYKHSDGSFRLRNWDVDCNVGTITIPSTDCLEIAFDSPFTKSPICVATMDYYSNSMNYGIFLGEVTTNRVRVKFKDLATNSLVINVNNIPTDTYFNIICIGS